MKKLPATLLAIVSIPFLVLGLLFLIAAAGRASRALVGLPLLAIGTAVLVTGLKRLRRLRDISPDILKTGAVEMARRMGGELTVSQLRAEYGIPRALATQVLDELARDGSCAPEQREDRIVYVFTGLLPSLVEKSCPYCSTKLPVRSALRKCPNCGASLEITKT